MVSAASARAYAALLMGLAIQAVDYTHPEWVPVPRLASLLAAGLLVYGCSVVAARKGYSPWFGLAGLTSIVGVVVLLLVPTSDAVPRPWRRSALPERDDPPRDKRP